MIQLAALVCTKKDKIHGIEFQDKNLLSSLTLFEENCLIMDSRWAVVFTRKDGQQIARYDSACGVTLSPDAILEEKSETEA